ncbi:Formyl-coenzyme A transferase (plasmid) [Tsukamurella tyrosinosolvens]|uniref:Formyl-CoA transferase n=1 Tax=Tsukamurella tyrosinosolvens TaxID=57704 RepID=A0A1H4XFX3_TSUTY|nr:CoA transferase [Tsukamurella tyrosinosolvens]KXO99822.1 carnitine dehydratase [Tsukamurella tyrosinosolvens]SED03624.1 formyl-CoA transferase [Tsukamurella tyrosinosolvens]VEH98152.1 Formyl-coenzyme A transferase [Tsukamurella tyrosinosolvens]
MASILDGIVVADFSRVLAGPLATVMLADLGADVIKLERPGTGDDTRRWGPPWTDGTSAYFESANRSKRSVELDLDDPEDRAAARELARRADVLVENFRSGSLDAKGFGYEELAAANPRLIYCSVTGFGSDAGAELPGYDFLVQALGGLMSITGEPDGDPMKVGVALVDVLTAKDAVAGILAALYERERSGRGQRVEVNLLSSLLGSLANQGANFLATGATPSRMGNSHPSIAPYETLRCRDGILAVACGNDGQFARLAATVGAADLADDPRFATNPDRVRHRAELVPLLEQGLAAHEAEEWARRLTEAGVPAGTVGDVASGFALAERLGLRPRVTVGDSAMDQVRNPIGFSRTPVVDYRRPPGLGEHTEAVRAALNSQHRRD